MFIDVYSCFLQQKDDFEDHFYEQTDEMFWLAS